MNDDFFTANKTWQAIQLGSENITNGTFSIVNKEDFVIHLTKGDTVPNPDDEGTFIMTKINEDAKYSLSIGEFLFVRSDKATSRISIIPA